MIGEMYQAAINAEALNPPTSLEYVMHPSAYMDLKAAGGVFLHRGHDGRHEFMGHPIREDVSQEGWALRPVEGSGDNVPDFPTYIPMPQSRADAEMMLLVAERYLSANPVGSAASDAEEQ